MQQKIQLRYVNARLHIGLVSWREAYLLQPTVILLKVEVDQGRLVYRAKGSPRRYTYHQVKKGLQSTSRCIVQEVPDWLYKGGWTHKK
jgi:hypothetical protein